MITTENYEYKLDEEHRNRIQEEAKHDQLVRLATQKEPEQEQKSQPKPRVTTRIRNAFVLLLKSVGILALVAVFLMPQFSSLAQGPFGTKTSGGDEPDSPALAPYRIGNYYYEQRDYEKAAVYFSKAIAILPRFGYALAARGDCYLALGKPELAVADYTLAIEVYPDYVSAYYTRGRAYHALGQLEQAVADYTQAIALMPEYAESYWGLADIRFEQGQYEAALANYRSYVERVTGTPDDLVIERIHQLEARAAASTI